MPAARLRRTVKEKTMKFKMRKEVKIGIFTVVILAVLYWGVNFLKGIDLFNRSNTYYAYYENVSGIQMSSPIIIHGINAGTVTGIKFRPDLGNTVEVKFDIKASYRIPDNSVARLFTNGLMGGKALEVELGDSSELLPDGATMLSESETDLLEMAGSELDFFKQRLSKLINTLDVTLQGVGSLIEENRGAIAGTLEGVRKGAQTFGDKSEELAAIIDDIGAVTGTLAANSQRIDSTMYNLNEVSSALAEADLAATVARLDEAVGQINELLAAVNAGEGSLGMLLNDTELYDSLAEASGNLASLLEDLEQHPGRYVHFSVFGGKAK